MAWRRRRNVILKTGSPAILFLAWITRRYNVMEYNVRAAAMPHWGSGSADVQYYSYTVGRVHIIALSDEQVCGCSPL